MKRLHLFAVLKLALLGSSFAQTIVIEGEKCVAPTFDRTPGQNTGSTAGTFPYGTDVVNGGTASGGRSIGFSWSTEYSSYDVRIPTTGYYSVSFWYGTLKSEAQILGPTCKWADCRDLPATYPWRVAIYARPGLCSTYASGTWNAATNPLPTTWKPLNNQNPAYNGVKLLTWLPKTFFGNTPNFTNFRKLTGPMPRLITAGQYCMQMSVGWDVNAWDRIEITKVAGGTCGNGTCDKALGEKCNTCPSDCGQCTRLGITPRIIGNVPQNYFYAWQFDPADVPGLKPYKELSTTDYGKTLWRPDAPDVDIATDEISNVMTDNRTGEHQSFTVWVAQAGTYTAGVHYSTKDAKGGAARLSVRMGPGACSKRAAAYSCDANAAPAGWVQILKPAFAVTPENTVGLVGGNEQGYRTVFGAPFTVAQVGQQCMQMCVLNGEYKTSRFVFKNTSFDAKKVVQDPNSPQVVIKDTVYMVPGSETAGNGAPGV